MRVIFEQPKQPEKLFLEYIHAQMHKLTSSMASQLCACGGRRKVKGERERFLILFPLPLTLYPSSISFPLLPHHQTLVCLLGFDVTYLGFNRRTLKEIGVGFGVELVGISEYIGLEVSFGNNAFFHKIPAFS